MSGLPTPDDLLTLVERSDCGPERKARARALAYGLAKGTLAIVAVPGPDGPPRVGDAIDAAHLARQRAWSERTFGPGPRTAGVIDHIRKELREIEDCPADLCEWVDVVILALDGAWRAGHEPQAIIDAIRAKQSRNEARIWPDWRTADPDRAIEHDRAVRVPVEPSGAPVGNSTDAEQVIPLREAAWHPRVVAEVAALRALRFGFTLPPGGPNVTQSELRRDGIEATTEQSAALFFALVARGDPDSSGASYATLSVDAALDAITGAQR